GLYPVFRVEITGLHQVAGFELYQLSRGIDERLVQANRIRKSLSNERTFSHNIETLEDCEAALQRQYGEMLDELRTSAADRKIAKIVIKLKFSDFRRTTAEISSHQPEPWFDESH
ncbi:hypothetical protein N9V19_03425, partial [Opitutales bacterium]|nr:hypothetical protein [Opitutales bacterium]